MSESLINEAAVRSLMKAKLNAAMLAAAEPHLQEALKEIERRMREALAQQLISIIEERVEFYRDDRAIRIIIDPRR